MEEVIDAREVNRVDTSDFPELYENTARAQPGTAQSTAGNCPTEAWLTVEETAKQLNISGNAVVKRLGKGKLRGRKVPGQYGDKWLVDSSSLPEKIILEFEPGRAEEQPGNSTGTARNTPEEPGESDNEWNDSSPKEAIPGTAHNIHGDTIKVFGEIIQTQNEQLKRQNELIFHLTEELRYRDNEIKLLTDSQHKRSGWSRFWIWFTGGRGATQK